jgi:hypothetical protein
LLWCLATAAADCIPITITDDVGSLYVLEGCPAVFSVGAVGSGPLLYQWFRNDQLLAGATNSSYTLSVARPSDNGARFQVQVTNACSQVVSAQGTLTISGNIVAPLLLRARGDSTLEQVIVAFSVGACGWPGLDPLTAQEISNYSISGGLVVSNALLDTNGAAVILTTTRQTPGSVYTLVANNVADLHGNRIGPGSNTRFQAWILVPGSDPPTVAAPPLIASNLNNSICIEWPLGSLLQQARWVDGPWETMAGAGHPYMTSITNQAYFFRAWFSP